jgi:PAS domain-containing protein
MSQRPIEVILTRQLASTLTMPVFLVDPLGTLVFYNEPAEVVLGMRFQETGEMPAEEWSSLWKASDDEGGPLPPDRLPLMITIAQQRPAHGAFWIHGLDGTQRRIEATAFPLIRQPDQILGAVVIFWESPS